MTTYSRQPKINNYFSKTESLQTESAAICDLKKKYLDMPC